MPENPRVPFPLSQIKFSVELFESGNAPDYSIIYAPGVRAARGESEGYEIDNPPKDLPNPTIQITGNSSSDIMRYNYMRIYGSWIGDMPKWYFIESKKMINYPDANADNWFCVEFKLREDVWETYKDRLGSPMISLNKVTTSDIGGWSDTSALEQDIIPFSTTQISTTPTTYNRWKAVVGWQSKKPSDQQHYVLDGMPTTMQFNDTGDFTDYIAGLEELASGNDVESRIWQTMIVCNTYIVSHYFATDDGTNSELENLTLLNPTSVAPHNRLNYWPYTRAFIETIDGQRVEFDYRRYGDNKLPSTLLAGVFHSMLPQPTSTIVPIYPQDSCSDCIVFSSYPTVDFVGKNITPVTQLVNLVKDGFSYETNPGGMQRYNSSNATYQP